MLPMSLGQRHGFHQWVLSLGSSNDGDLRELTGDLNRCLPGKEVGRVPLPPHRRVRELTSRVT